MEKNPLVKIQELGQSVWLDFLRRGLITSGELTTLIEEDGLRGVTSNPSIFDKVIAGSHDYDDDIRFLSLKGMSAGEIYEALTIKDVQDAADLFRPVYDRLNGKDGFVSLEVNPHLAGDVEGTDSSAVAALLAGADLLLRPLDENFAIESVRDAIRIGELSVERIDESVRRILSAKYRRLVAAGSTPPEDPHSSLGSDAHNAVVRQIRELAAGKK